jgi:hypothetical protein
MYFYSCFGLTLCSFVPKSQFMLITEMLLFELRLILQQNLVLEITVFHFLDFLIIAISLSFT